MNLVLLFFLLVFSVPLCLVPNASFMAASGKILFKLKRFWVVIRRATFGIAGHSPDPSPIAGPPGLFSDAGQSMKGATQGRIGDVVVDGFLSEVR